MVFDAVEEEEDEQIDETGEYKLVGSKPNQKGALKKRSTQKRGCCESCCRALCCMDFKDHQSSVQMVKINSTQESDAPRKTVGFQEGTAIGPGFESGPAANVPEFQDEKDKHDMFGLTGKENLDDVELNDSTEEEVSDEEEEVSSSFTEE